MGQFAAQSDHQILFTTEMVANRRTGGVSGRMTVTEALDRLLVGSGLYWRQTRPGVFTLRRANGTGAETVEVLTPPAALDDIIVTGSLLKVSGELASPVRVLGRDELDRSGRATVAEVLTDLPQNYAGSGTPTASLAGADSGGSNSSVATGVNLRGLGPDSTLVLINGRRMAGTGYRGEFADLSALPSAAVRACGRLVGWCIRSLRLGCGRRRGQYHHAPSLRRPGEPGPPAAAQGGAEDLMASHLIGKTWSSGGVLAAYEYQHLQPLSSPGSVLYARRRPAAVRRLGLALHLRRARQYRGLQRRARRLCRLLWPATQRQRPGPDAGGFHGGEPDLDSVSQGVDLSPSQERHSLYTRVTQAVGDRLSLAADVRFSTRDYAFATTPASTVFQVTSANPVFVSPNGQSAHTLAYSFHDDLGASRYTGTSRSLGVNLGGDYDLGRGWSADAYVSYAEERGESRLPGQIHAGRLDEALGNVADNPATPYVASRDGYFDPFAAGGLNTPEVLAFVTSGFINSLDRSRATSANLLLEGPVATLPGGEVRLAIGAQVRREAFNTRSSSFTSGRRAARKRAGRTVARCERRLRRGAHPLCRRSQCAAGRPAARTVRRRSV